MEEDELPDSIPKKRFRAAGRIGPVKHSWDEDWVQTNNYDGLDDAAQLKALNIFIFLLAKEWAVSSMSARTLCVLIHFACLAGLRKEGRKYAVPPGKQSGFYQKHMDVAFDLNKKEEDVQDYPLSLPSFDGKNVRRTVI